MKLEHPALYCRAPRSGRGGENFFWDRQSHIKESELSLAPTPVLSSWITEKATKAEWTSRIHEFRSKMIMGKEVPSTSRALDFENDEESIFKNSYTPVKNKKTVDGMEATYEFVGEVGSVITAPDFSEAEDHGLDVPWEDPDDLLGVIERVRATLIEQRSQIGIVNGFATKSEKRAGARANQIIEKLNSLVEVVSTLRRYVGAGERFENLTGYSNVFDGLLGLYNSMDSVSAELGLEIRAEMELGDHGIGQEVGRLETKLERAILKIDVMDMMMKDMVEKELKEFDVNIKALGDSQRVAGETFARTMHTLSKSLLPGLLEMS
jgi:hypothetical protein